MFVTPASALCAATIGRADRERQVAKQERRLADAERGRVGRRDKNEREQFRAMRTRERSAELHDAIAALFAHDA